MFMFDIQDTSHLEKAKTGYFGHMKVGSRMIGYSALVFVTSTIHAIFPFLLNDLSAWAARRLSAITEETFKHHEA